MITGIIKSSLTLGMGLEYAYNSTMKYSNKLKVKIFSFSFRVLEGNIMERTKWLDRIFNFDFPIGLMKNIIVRLTGTLPRLKDLTHNLSDDQLKYQPHGNWSIKEHIGHLAASELLHEGRIDDIIAHKEILRAALFRKPDTEKTDYNLEDISDLLSRFHINRQRFVERLESLDDEVQGRRSLHPRLQVMMRPIDVAFFTAEHDDHHLAAIHEILKSY